MASLHNNKKAPFASVAEAERIGRKRVPFAVRQTIINGTEAGETMDSNVRAYSELGFVPRLGSGPLRRDKATTVMGQPISLPVMTTPAGVQGIHPDAEVAIARGAAKAGTAMGLSGFASKSMEEVVAANPATFQQLYWMGGRDRMAAIVERARAAGIKGLMITLDWSFATRRDWKSAMTPDRLSLRNAVLFAPQALRRPRWLLTYLRRAQLPEVTVPNLSLPGKPPPLLADAYVEWMETPLPSWDDVAWLRQEWGGPFLVKGVMHPDDAKRAVDTGATAISVSNHGGNNLDGTPASLRALSGVADAVGGDLEILLDGGVRRGGDVVKALALGARAVMVGRVYFWALAAGGEAGVAHAIEILRTGIDETLIGLARDSIQDLGPSDVLVPDGFHLSLGGS